MRHLFRLSGLSLALGAALEAAARLVSGGGSWPI